MDRCVCCIFYINLDQAIVSQGDEQLMTQYHNYWQRFSKGSEYINSLFSYLNQQFIKKQRKTESDYTYGDVSVIDPKTSFLEIGAVRLTWAPISCTYMLRVSGAVYTKLLYRLSMLLFYLMCIEIDSLLGYVVSSH